VLELPRAANDLRRTAWQRGNVSSYAFLVTLSSAPSSGRVRKRSISGWTSGSIWPSNRLGKHNARTTRIGR
jgi:hypothetical protein